MLTGILTTSYIDRYYKVHNVTASNTASVNSINDGQITKVGSITIC